MGKLVMGYWDCPYCSTKHIEGTKRECPSCGKPRGQEVKFYMDGVRYLSAEESQTKGKGADWLCDHCGNYNSALNTRCSSCGAERDSQDKAYFDVRTGCKECQECIWNGNSCRRTKQRAGWPQTGSLIWSMEDSADWHAGDSGDNWTYGDHSHAEEENSHSQGYVVED